MGQRTAGSPVDDLGIASVGKAGWCVAEIGWSSNCVYEANSRLWANALSCVTRIRLRQGIPLT
jgi:hypothetical protein